MDKYYHEKPGLSVDRIHYIRPLRDVPPAENKTTGNLDRLIEDIQADETEELFVDLTQE